ncbi:hypothetical protein F5X68DRAFT_228050 [Plectosphaerella plurivora]|uniref:Uncharacterized protein n=1 Tax=Plectosphaerella plurivora TaxID=936078 RepID=A0A9P8VJT1_9PEZI|nr:hypothetical protein F5X68DRAFT_228050 [Plectosphaerella plurivora]
MSSPPSPKRVRSDQVRFSSEDNDTSGSTAPGESYLDTNTPNPRIADAEQGQREPSINEIRVIRRKAVDNYIRELDNNLPDYFKNGETTHVFLHTERACLEESLQDIMWVSHDTTLANKPEYSVRPEAPTQLAALLREVYKELPERCFWQFVPLGARRFQCPLHSYDATACDSHFGLKTIEDVIAHMEVDHHEEANGENRCPRCFRRYTRDAVREAHIHLDICTRLQRPAHWGITSTQAADLRAFALTHNTDQIFDEFYRQTRDGIPRSRGPYLDDYSSWVVHTVAQVVNGAGELRVPAGEVKGEETAAEWYITRLSTDLLRPRVKARQALFEEEVNGWEALSWVD